MKSIISETFVGSYLSSSSFARPGGFETSAVVLLYYFVGSKFAFPYPTLPPSVEICKFNESMPRLHIYRSGDSTISTSFVCLNPTISKNLTA